MGGQTDDHTSNKRRRRRRRRRTTTSPSSSSSSSSAHQHHLPLNNQQIFFSSTPASASASTPSSSSLSASTTPTTATETETETETSTTSQSREHQDHHSQLDPSKTHSQPRPPPPPQPAPSKTSPQPQVFPPSAPLDDSKPSQSKPTPIPTPPINRSLDPDIHKIENFSIPQSSLGDHLLTRLSSLVNQARDRGSSLLTTSQLNPQELQALRQLLCSSYTHHPSSSTSPPPSLFEFCRQSSTWIESTSDHASDHHSSSHNRLQRRSYPVTNSNSHHILLPRQALQGNGTGPFADGYPSCTAVSNAILSCFPQSHTVLVQHTWSKFIWNNNYPTFIGSRYVDIYLFNANSETQVANWTSIANDRGMIGIYADDSWFPSVTTWQNGRNLTYPYFFIITTAGSALTGAEQHQATFSVVQTAPPANYISSSIASVSASIAAAHPSSVPSPTPNSSLQPGSNGDSFPKWEIALIVILGAFALLIFLVAAYLAFNNARKRRQVRIWQAAALGTKSVSGGSVASHSPMIQNTEGIALMGHQKHPGVAGGGTGIVASARDLHSPNSSRPGSPLSANNAPGAHSFGLPPGMIDHQTGSDTQAKLDGPITSVDATIMADAFRKALRKPEFVVPESVPEDSKATEGTSSVGPNRQQKDRHPDDPHPSADRDKAHSDESTSAFNSHHVRKSMHAQVISADDEAVDPLHDDDRDGTGGETEEAKDIIDRELASEGRSMTSVDNRKRPKVHG